MSYFDSDLSEGEYVVLRAFYPKAIKLTIKDVMKNTSYSSYERNNSYLKSLAKKGVIKEERIGKTLVYSLIFDNWHSKKAFHSYALEKARLFSKKHQIIAMALKELSGQENDFLAVFGSYARGKEGNKSDIDILCVTNYKKKTEVMFASIRRKYDLPIHSIVMSKTEFAKIQEENSQFWDNLKNDGLIFKGYDLFYYYAYGF